MIERVKYCDLRNGETFKLFKSDLRVFKKETDGALQIKDFSGYPCETCGFRVYPYLTMTVYKED